MDDDKIIYPTKFKGFVDKVKKAFGHEPNPPTVTLNDQAIIKILLGSDVVRTATSLNVKCTHTSWVWQYGAKGEIIGIKFEFLTEIKDTSQPITSF